MNTPLYPVAILAGGLATRMRPLTETIPKALLDVHGEPFIAHQLRLLAGQGAGRIVVCVGYLGERVEQWVGDGQRFGLDVRFSYDGPRLLGTAGALARALPLLGGRFFVLYGDSYLPCDFTAVQRAFDAAGQLALMTVFRNEGRFDASNVLFEAGRIVTYDKVRRTAAMHHIDYGLGLFDRCAFDTVPGDRPSGLAELYQAMLARGELAACEIHERFYEIGSFEGLEETCQYLQATARRSRAG
jgi:N-acetyl-alpha-D-muramate 1-phosphate uridylyltransferase